MEQYPPIPGTPTLARAYEEGILDASFGQVISFASDYQTSFRIEVPLWHKIEDAIADPGLADQAKLVPVREIPSGKGPSPRSSSEATERPGKRSDRAEAEAEEEEAEEENYVPATGQGCYSFEMSLLQRAAQTFAKCSVIDKYRQVAQWLHTGLAMTISRKSWHLLSKHRTRTVTPLALLRVHFERGYLSTEKEDRKKPYVATDVQAQAERGWELHVNSVIRTGYYAVTNRFRTTREARAESDFFRTIDRTIELPNTEETSPKTGTQIKEQTPRRVICNAELRTLQTVGALFSATSNSVKPQAVSQDTVLNLTRGYGTITLQL